ncbi:unnamed protein product [Phyllotreta striolata]|uniref:Uncharacterized protein n=1 Tax=Phyllotreta striolata TaxID=444603 RepID=A0A9N9TRM6_PHYSR|nr:unnamed protein product [Phyllotreta striolata]
MDDDEKLVDQITGDFDEGYYGNYGFMGQYHEPSDGACVRKDAAAATPKKCVRKGDVICYIKSENIKTVTAGGPPKSAAAESVGSESKSRSSTDTTDQSGESLYKTFIFEESVNENDTQKCIAFWKSVMEKNLEPIKCTIIENRRKREKKPAIEETKTLSVEEPPDVNALIKEATDKVHAEYKTLWLAALKEIKDKKLDKVKLVAQARCKLCESMEIPMEEYSTDIDAATAKEEVKALNKWESVSKRAKRGDKKGSKEVDWALRQKEKEQVQYRFVNVIEEKKKSGAYKMWRSNLVKPPCRCGKKNCECNTNPAIICMRTPLASRIERRSEPIPVPKPAVQRTSHAESISSSRRPSEVCERRSLKKPSVQSTPIPPLPKVPSPLPAPPPPALQPDRSFVDEHTQTQERPSVKSTPERVAEPLKVDRGHQTEEQIVRVRTSDKSVNATGSSTGRVEEDESKETHEDESNASTASTVNVRMATPFLHDLTKSIISEISSLNLPFVDVSTFLKMPSEQQLEAVSALVLTRAYGHDLSEMQLRDISQVILDHVLDMNETRSEGGRDIEEDEGEAEQSAVPPREKSPADSKGAVGTRASKQSSSGPAASQQSGSVRASRTASEPISAPAVPRASEPRSSVLKAPTADLSQAPGPAEASPKPTPVQPFVAPAAGPPRSSILADLEELTPRGSAVMERQVSLLLPDGEVEVIQRTSRVDVGDTTWEKPTVPRTRVPAAERKGSVEALKFKKMQTSKVNAGEENAVGDQIVHVFSTQGQNEPAAPAPTDEDDEDDDDEEEYAPTKEEKPEPQASSREKLLAVVDIESEEPLPKPAAKKSTTFLNEKELDDDYEETFNPNRVRDSIYVSKERLEKLKDKDESALEDEIDMGDLFKAVTLEDSYLVNKRRLDRKARDSIFVTKERLMSKKKSARKSIDVGLEQFRLKLRQAKEKRQSEANKSADAASRKHHKQHAKRPKDSIFVTKEREAKHKLDMDEKESDFEQHEPQRIHIQDAPSITYVQSDRKTALPKDSMYINKAHVMKHKLEHGEIDSIAEASTSDRQVHVLIPDDRQRQIGAEKSILKHHTKLIATKDSVFVTKQRVLQHRRDMRESLDEAEPVLRLSKAPRARTPSGSLSRRARGPTAEPRGSYVPPNSPDASRAALQEAAKKEANSSRELHETDYESLVERAPESKLAAFGSNKAPCEVCLCKKCRCKAGSKIKRTGAKGRKFAPACPFAGRSKKSKKHGVAQFVEFGSEFVSVKLSNVTEKTSPYG